MTSNPKAPLDSVVLQVVSAGWEKFGDEPNTKLPDGAQMIDGEWYIPKWGCDSLEATLDALQAILQNDKLTGSALFDKCVEYKLMKDGMVEIHCKNGLWSVAGRDRKQVEREAAHYWQQYYADGEYNSILLNVKGEPR
jgi:hypothetical protein